MSRILKVMGALLRGTGLLLATLALATLGHAYVLIDDFQTGEYHGALNWPNTHLGHEFTGLDKAHSAFGRRTVDLSVDTNFDHVSLNVDLAGGVERVSYGSHNVATRLDTGFGDNGSLTVDFSQEDQFWADVFTENPGNRLADGWNLFARDALGHTGSNGFFISRPGGIKFLRSGFSGNLDWAHITFMRFTQEFSPNIGTVPLAYGATVIYATPEPGTGLLALALGLGFLSRRARQARREPCP